MPKDGSRHHPRPDAAADGYTPPAWLGPVKVAVVVMTVLIVLGVLLLVYGFAKGIKQLEGGGSRNLTLFFPSGLEPAGASTTAEGEVLLLFRERDGGPAWEAVTVDPASREVTGRITLVPGDGFRLGD